MTKIRGAREPSRSVPESMLAMTDAESALAVLGGLHQRPERGKPIGTLRKGNNHALLIGRGTFGTLALSTFFSWRTPLPREWFCLPFGGECARKMRIPKLSIKPLDNECPKG